MTLEESHRGILSNLKGEIECAMCADRHRLRIGLRTIERLRSEGKPFDQKLARIQAETQKSLALREERERLRPVCEYDDSLPIVSRSQEIKSAIADNQVVIICGETGSGKSTQLPKLCLELGRGISGMIAHTQPRRIAARTIAARVAEELKVAGGTSVAYKIRFSDTSSPETMIKLMTDGILLAETQSDRFLNRYDTIIIDEAHERSLNIDFLLGYLKRLLPKRPELRLIITSATIDAERFAQHFSNADSVVPVIEVSGRTYLVDVEYRPVESGEESREPDWQRAVISAVEEIATLDNGDILIFMPTERDIRDAARLLRSRQLAGDRPGQETEVLPLYSRLSVKEQNRVFQSHSHRRIVLATNVAESSLTVPGIQFVIDPGTARISRYSPRSKVQRLPIEPVSQASANQRKGRCGRVGPGICFRLYSEQDFQSREEFTPPEIQRTNLASVILQTKSLKLGQIEEFPFLDPPKPAAVKSGYHDLYELQALNEQDELTEIGRKLCRFPVDPRIGRMILGGHDEGCLREVLIIAAALELQDPRFRPVDKQQAADEAHAQFADESSDFLGYLKLWDFYHEQREKLSRSQLRKACEQNFLSYNRLREWSDVHRQLKELAATAQLRPNDRKNDADDIHRALLAGLLSNIAYLGENREYTGAGGIKLRVWPGSVLNAKKPKWIMAGELIETERRYARIVARINPEWVEPLAAHLIKKSHSDPHWDSRTGAAKAFEKVSLFGLPVVARRQVQYGPIDAEKSRELFIQHALVEEDLSTGGKFQSHNRLVLEELEELQAKSRRVDLVPEEEELFRFYNDRVPAHVYDRGRFEKWRKKAEQENSRLLHLSRNELFKGEAETRNDADFPDEICIGSMRLSLEYRLEPGSEDDGITINVPIEGVNQLEANRLGWLVPGLLEEKVTAVIKSLPKSIRRMFVPVPDTARTVMQQLEFAKGGIEQAIAEILTRISGERIAPTDFDTSRLPPQLRMNIRVIDSEGEAIQSSRDPEELRRELGQQASIDFKQLNDDTWNQSNISVWNFGELPERVELVRNGVTLQGCPALQDDGESVSLRLFDTPHQATSETKRGVVRLFLLAHGKSIDSQLRHFPRWNEVSMFAATLPDASVFRKQVAELVGERAFFPKQKIPRSEAEFGQQSKLARNRITVAIQELAALLPQLMEGYQQIRVQLEKTKVPAWEHATNDLWGQLKQLTQVGFLTRTPWEWLQQYPRYFQAMSQRLQKLSTNLARDRQHTATVAKFWNLYSRQSQYNEEQKIDDPNLMQFRWMIEEFRVSLFAQQLRTVIKISEKRLDEQWRKIKSS